MHHKKRQDIRKYDAGPNPTDIHVGARLKLRRNLLGMSQDQMGKALGLTFQQIQKYERGTNRMGASRIYQVAKLLNVPVGWFFEDMESTTLPRAGFAESAQAPLADAPEQPDTEILQKHETLKLVRAYYRITDPKQRRRILDLMKAMAAGQE